jgi:hypothetical protein
MRRTGLILLPAASLFVLRELPFERFAYPRWQAVAAITFIGALAGLDPAIRAGTPEVPGLPLWLAVPTMILTVWVSFFVILAVLRWWMKRGGRWDGQGDLFNLVAASWLVASVLGAGAVALGVPPLLTLPLYLYAIWVGGNALSGAMPKASLGYSIAGIVIGLIPATLAAGLIAGVAVFASAALAGA